jgi:hypothetical protein
MRCRRKPLKGRSPYKDTPWRRQLDRAWRQRCLLPDPDQMFANHGD